MNLIEQLIKYETAVFQATASNWQEAVKIGTDLLERRGSITPEYYQDILENVKELGPYFLLSPGVAMPHARPERGVIETSYALVTLKEGVNFGDKYNDPIDVLVTMAAKDSKVQNEESIVQVVTILDDEETMKKLRKMTTIDELKPLVSLLKEFSQ